MRIHISLTALGLALAYLNGCQLITDFSHESVSAVGGGAGEDAGGAASDSTSTAKGGKTAKGGTSGKGGTTAKGGTSSTGGASVVSSSSGGATASGGAATVPNSTGGVGGMATSGGTTATSGGTTATSGGTTATSGGTTSLSCSGTLKVCGSLCVDTQTDKANCGTCGAKCDGYQFCATGKCLPNYSATRVQPMSSGSVMAAEVVKSKGDLIIEVAAGDTAITLSAPGSSVTNTVGPNTVALARYTASGVLAWGRDIKGIISENVEANASKVSTFALNASGDVGIAYEKYFPSTGPVAGTYAYMFARINGNNATLTWEAQTDATAYRVMARTASNDFITLGSSPSFWQGVQGSLCQIVDSGTAGTPTNCSLPWYGHGAAVGADGSTLWIWSAYGGTHAISPWSTQTWTVPTNPSQAGGSDALVMGAKSGGSVVGPWLTEGDFGPNLAMVVDENGDLIFVVASSGYTTFNGGQDLASGAGNTLIKIDHSSGTIVWKTALSSPVLRLAMAPGNRILTIGDPGAVSGPTPLKASVYAGASGQLLSSFTIGAYQYASEAPLIAAGTTDVFMVGKVSTASDHNPGTAVDSQGSTAGVAISRYTF